MARNPLVTRMQQEIATLDDYYYFIGKYNTQRGIAEHFNISPKPVSTWIMKLKMSERVEKRLSR